MNLSIGFTYCTPITRKKRDLKRCNPVPSDVANLRHFDLRGTRVRLGRSLPSLEQPGQRVQHHTASVRRLPAVPCRARSLDFYRLSKTHRLFEITPLMYSFKSRKSLTLQSNGASFTPFSRKVLGIKSPLGRSIIDDTITPG